MKRAHKLDDKGFILVVTMVLAMVALAVTGAMLFMATVGSKIAGGVARYANTVSAARGASDVAMNLLKNSASSTAPDFGTVRDVTCLDMKLHTATCATGPSTTTACTGGTGTTYYQWPAANCGTYATATSTDATVNPDITSTFLDANTGTTTYTVYTKIINTQSATTATTAPTMCNCSSCTYCYVYTVLILSTKNSSSERSLVTFTYAIYDGNNLE
ncbi:MAG: hypothetical protein L7F77_09335 [Candidatus Magnetominusculus sp. LBB02]|nr:hypothetical protein [Candidatus Magnetominusculus sp. LBB02]